LDSLSYIDDYGTQAKRLSNPIFNTTCIEIASLFSTGETEWAGGEVPEENIKRLKADETEIEYSPRPWFASKSINWPHFIYSLLKDCLEGSSGLATIGAESFSTDATTGKSQYNGDYDLIR
jgi:hypothetical protein